MMKYVFTASAKLVISVGDGTGEYSDVPFWTVRKDCNGGFVVEEGEPCPRICPDGSVVLENLPCPVKQAPVKNEPIIKEENNNKPMFEGNEAIIGAGIAILFVISLIGFKVFGKKKEESYGYYPQNPQHPQY